MRTLAPLLGTRAHWHPYSVHAVTGTTTAVLLTCPDTMSRPSAPAHAASAYKFDIYSGWVVDCQSGMPSPSACHGRHGLQSSGLCACARSCARTSTGSGYVTLTRHFAYIRSAFYRVRATKITCHHQKKNCDSSSGVLPCSHEEEKIEKIHSLAAPPP